MPINTPIEVITIELGKIDHPGVHTEDRVLLEDIRSIVDQSIHVADVTGVTSVSYAGGAMKDFQLTGNTTFSFATGAVGVPGQPVSISMRLRQDSTGSRAVTWTNVRWPGGAAPGLTSPGGREDWLVFTSLDNGATWTGALALKDVR